MDNATKITLIASLFIFFTSPLRAEPLPEDTKPPEARLVERLADLTQIVEKNPQCGKSGRLMSRWIDKHKPALVAILSELDASPPSALSQQKLDDQLAVTYQILADRALLCAEHEDIKEAFAKFRDIAAVAPPKAPLSETTP